MSSYWYWWGMGGNEKVEKHYCSIKLIAQLYGLFAPITVTVLVPYCTVVTQLEFDEKISVRH